MYNLRVSYFWIYRKSKSCHFLIKFLLCASSLLYMSKMLTRLQNILWYRLNFLKCQNQCVNLFLYHTYTPLSNMSKLSYIKQSDSPLMPSQIIIDGHLYKRRIWLWLKYSLKLVASYYMFSKRFKTKEK